MGKATLALLVLVALVAVACARPLEFFGGSFYQARGHYSPGFAVYTDNGQNDGWSRLESTAAGFDGPILDMYPVGEGVFAVGAFAHIGENQFSQGVAYYDGSKWCAVRQSINFALDKKRGGLGSGPSAVWCDSDVSCWVAGDFHSMHNIPTYLNQEFANFIHYTFDNVSSEWIFDFDVQAWNNNTAGGFIQTLPAGALPGSLIGLRNQSDNHTYFFVGTGSFNSMTVYRGSQLDNGWRVLTQSLSTSLDFGFDQSSYPPTFYSITGDAPNVETSSIWVVDNLLAPCTHTNCDLYIIQNGFINHALIPVQTNTAYIQSYTSIWSYNQTRYLIALYDPDGTADNRQARYVVLKQTGNDDPVPLGQPFTVNTAQEIYYVRGHPLNQNWAYVTGSVLGANLFFPEGDNEGPISTDVSVDRRSLDHVTFVAQFRDLGRWEQAFGGGFLEFSAPSPTNMPVRWNPNTEQWFVAQQGISYVYDVLANGAAYYDNSPAAGQPSVFPVFTRAIWRRPSQLFEGPVNGVTAARVFEFMCYSDCENVYVGGDFSFHGNDTLGAIALVQVQSSGDTVLQSVGGGLWYTDQNVVRDNPDLQFTAGEVYALAQQDDYLYAAGFFSRAKAGYVCLSNVARIRKTTDSSADFQWEDLNGGCNSEVFDLQFWEGRLYAAGQFKWCGNKMVNYVADYTYQSGSNAEWNALNNGLDGVAFSIEPFGGRLIFAGEFQTAGGIPAAGVASWNKAHWRPLLAACTDDCIPGSLQYYFNVLNSPSFVYNLKAAKDGNFLYARADFAPEVSSSSVSSLSSSGGSTATYLARWEYVDGDSGIWTVKGPQAQYSLVQFHKRGDGVNVNNGTLVLVGGSVSDGALTRSNQAFHTWDDDSRIQNYLGTHLVFAPEVFVLRSSASSLSSPFAFLLNFF